MGQNGEEEMLAIQEETGNPDVPLSLCALLSRMGGQGAGNNENGP